MSEEEEIRRVQKEEEDYLLSLPNVEGVMVDEKITAGEGTGKLAIVVMVREKVDVEDLDEDDVVPSSVDGVCTDVQETGEIVAGGALDIGPPMLGPDGLDRQGRHRPVPFGVSIGHPDVTAGTVGWLYENDAGAQWAGSNNHVLANINRGELGDPILQPGPEDGGQTGEDRAGGLAYYKPIEDGVTVDLALYRKLAEHENRFTGVEKPIRGVVDDISRGDTLVKTGRTTAVTRGKVRATGASVNVRYPPEGSIKLTEVIVTTKMLEGGDSGSPVAKETADGLYAAARGFGGSPVVAVHHDIRNEIAAIQEDVDPSIQLVTQEKDEPEPVSVVLRLRKKEADPNEYDVEIVAIGDRTETPLADVQVTMRGGDLQRSGITGSDGVVVFKAVTPGAYSFTGTKEGYQPASASIDESRFPMKRLS